MKVLININPPTTIIVTKRSTQKSIQANIKHKQKELDKNNKIVKTINTEQAENLTKE